MHRLELHVLGGFQATLNGTSIDRLRSNKTRALLAYLLVEPPVPQRRESLATLFWGESSEHKANLSLRVALSNLRKTLGIQDEDDEAPDSLLVITRRTVQRQIRDENCWVDVRAFESRLHACQIHTHTALENCAECAGRLEHAVLLYKGDFLAGITLSDAPLFDEWRLLHQEQYHQRALAALDILARYHMGQGNFKTAQQYARRELELEPWRETAHRQLMLALARDGDPEAAREQYRLCRKILRAELGAEPQQATTALYQQIRTAKNRSRTRSGGDLPSPRAHEESAPAPAPRHTLPAPLTAFVGRETELAQIDETLDDSSCRLLTLVGPGGIGKSRLILQAAAAQAGKFYDGLAYVSLNAGDEQASFITRLAQALKIGTTSSQTVPEHLQTALHDKQLLLICDGMEQHLPAAGLIDDVLRAAPRVKVLVSSRQRLNLQGEWLFHVGGLSYPLTPMAAHPERYSAVQLFVQSVRRVRPGFTLTPENQSDIIEICRLTDGMPLALELAATWMRVMPCHDIAKRIRHDFSFLSTTYSNVPRRHRDIRAVFDYSWSLLSPRERSAFLRLAVFPGSFDWEAGVMITEAELPAAPTTGLPVGLPILTELVDKSLLHLEAPGSSTGAVRCTLQSLVRQYALEKLAENSQELSRALQRHTEIYLQRLANLHQAPPDLTAAEYARLEVDLHNVRAAWLWAAQNGSVPQLIESLPGFLELVIRRGFIREGEQLVRESIRQLQQRTAPAPAEALGRLLVAHATILNALAQYNAARGAAQTGLALAESCDAVYIVSQARLALGTALGRSGDLTAGLSHLGQALAAAPQLADPRIHGQILLRIGEFQMHRADHEAALETYEHALALFREAGDVRGESETLGALGNACACSGDDAKAQHCLEESLRLSQIAGDIFTGYRVLLNLGITHNERGDHERAAQHLRTALKHFHESGARLAEGTALLQLGRAKLATGALAEARTDFEQAYALAQTINSRYLEASAHIELSLLANQECNDGTARSHGEQALHWGQALDNVHLQAEAWLCLGHADFGLERLEEAASAYREAQAAYAKARAGRVHPEPLAGLIRVASVRENDARHIRPYLETLLTQLRIDPELTGTHEPGRVYLTCYRALCDVQDERAASLLDAAQTWLQNRAARIQDPLHKQSFLQGIPAHKALRDAFHREHNVVSNTNQL
ncbi:MAG: tetratricopeptide repeat protein [Anaerolineae bacterium]|nr:tetratricopeptide repeat protein [Anaerolineae bacterium]